MRGVLRYALRDLASLITKGTTPKTLGLGHAPTGIPFLRAENIRELSVVPTDSPLFIDEQVDEALRRSRIQPSDVLVSIAGTIGRVGVVPEDAPPMNCNQAVAIIRLGERLLPRYLAHWLTSQDAQAQMARAQVTATISNLSLGQIGELAVPVPPLAEQERIVGILDKSDAIRQKRRKAIILTDELLRSAFLELFGDPMRNPKGWPLSQFEAVVRDVTGGNPKLQQTQYLRSGTYPVIDQGADFVGGWTDDSSLVAKVRLPAVLFGDHTKTLKWVDDEFVLGADGVKILEPQELLLPEFLYSACLLFPFPNVGYSRHFKFLKLWAIPVPPMPEQRRYASLFHRIRSNRPGLEEAAVQAELLFGALASQAFLRDVGC